MKFSKILAPCAFAATLILQTYLAFRCTGNDWGGAIGNAEVISVSSVWPSKFPAFSYFYNGGAYLFQEPQSFVPSPVSQVFVRAFGTSAGLRWFMVFYTALGWLALFAWLRRKIGEIPASFSATAWCLSLFFFWRAAAGHVPFFVHLALPVFLILIERIRTLAAGPARGRELAAHACTLGVLAAWVGYEPSFHSLFYLMIPTCLAWAGVLIVSEERGRPRAAITLFGAVVVALLILCPRWMSWRHLPMGRGRDVLDATLQLRDVLYGQFATARAGLMGFRVPGTNHWHFIWEVSSALFPPAALMAVVGLGSGAKARRPEFWLGLICFVFGITVASNETLWRLVQSMTSSGIRVPSRFLGMSAFGLAVLAGFGAQFLLQRWKRVGPALVAAALALTVVFAADWIRRAEAQGTIRKDSVSWIEDRPRASLPDHIWRDRYCGVGSGCMNADSAEYETDPYRVHIQNKPMEAVLDDPKDRSTVVLDHREIVVRPAPDRTEVGLLLKKSYLGEMVETEPSGAPVGIAEQDGHMVLKIGAPGTVREIRVRPVLPFPAWSVWVAGISLLLSLIYSLCWKW